MYAYVAFETVSEKTFVLDRLSSPDMIPLSDAPWICQLYNIIVFFHLLSIAAAVDCLCASLTTGSRMPHGARSNEQRARTDR